jgi:uncharacterized membrane protein
MSHRTQLIICLFDAADKAEEVERAIEELDRRLESVKLGNIAVVEKGPNGQISFKETRDHRGNIGRVAGTLVGGVTDLFFSFMGSLGTAAGPLASYETESIANRFLGDEGFSDSDLYEVGQRLDAGHSALITLATPEEEPIVEAELQKLGGTILKQVVPPETLAELTRET